MMALNRSRWSFRPRQALNKFPETRHHGTGAAVNVKHARLVSDVTNYRGEKFRVMVGLDYTRSTMRGKRAEHISQRLRVMEVYVNIRVVKIQVG